MTRHVGPPRPNIGADLSHDPNFDLHIILEHQHPAGAFVASPDYSQYPFCWLRDGSFIAHALDRAGETASSARFHAWVARAVLGSEDRIRELIAARASGGPLDHGRMPPARFTLDGAWEEGDWPNFQLDGYGQWLWSLERHVSLTGSEPARELLEAATVVADYLVAFWDEPCYDAWEEGRTQHHTSTLASCCAGLRAAAALPGASSAPAGGSAADPYAEAAMAAWRYIEDHCVTDGHFTKRVRSEAVDASLLWLATPFDLLEEDDPRFVRTLERIERELVVDGGVTRYREDTFYGGGAWVLLTAWLAWHHARYGRRGHARELLEWVEATRAEDGSLPEQVRTGRSDAWFEHYWTERWGPSARRLLWSHAMTLLARSEVGRGAPG